MHSERARDQLPPTMDHKGTVEISSEYHAVGGMGIGQPAVTFSTRGTFLFKAKRIFFWIVFSQATNYTSGYQCLQVSTKQLKTADKVKRPPTSARLLKTLFTNHYKYLLLLALLGPAACPTSSG